MLLVWFRFSTGFFFLGCVSRCWLIPHIIRVRFVCRLSVVRYVIPATEALECSRFPLPSLTPSPQLVLQWKDFKKKEGEEEWIRGDNEPHRNIYMHKQTDEGKMFRKWRRDRTEGGRPESPGRGKRGWSELDPRAEDSVFEISATTNPQHSLSIRVWTGLLQLMPQDKNCKTESEGEKIRGIETRDLERNVLLIAALWRRYILGG